MVKLTTKRAPYASGRGGGSTFNSEGVLLFLAGAIFKRKVRSLSLVGQQ